MRKNYYQDLSADYSKPNAVDAEASARLIAMAEKFAAMKAALLPEVNKQYTWEQIELENKEWWPTHCEALRQGRGDILTSEYRADLVYFCQDGPYYGLDEQKDREKHWWALLAQPSMTMTWPIVMFHQEFVHFEWACMDDVTNETIAKGTVCWVRRGHRGGCHFKSEQLTFYRDVFAPESLLPRISALQHERELKVSGKHLPNSSFDPDGDIGRVVRALAPRLVEALSDTREASHRHRPVPS
jgi:hypothetical protein